jgi:hypothetical protein
MHNSETQRGPGAAANERFSAASVPPNFNTEITETLRALRVEGLMLAEYTEPLPGDDILVRT